MDKKRFFTAIIAVMAYALASYIITDVREWIDRQGRSPAKIMYEELG